MRCCVWCSLRSLLGGSFTFLGFAIFCVHARMDGSTRGFGGSFLASPSYFGTMYEYILGTIVLCQVRRAYR